MLVTMIGNRCELGTNERTIRTDVFERFVCGLQVLQNSLDDLTRPFMHLLGVIDVLAKDWLNRLLNLYFDVLSLKLLATEIFHCSRMWLEAEEATVSGSKTCGLLKSDFNLSRVSIGP